MIFSGSVTLAVSDFERAVRFYSETLGLKLNMRFGDQWAVLDGGGGLLIALMPQAEDIDLGVSIGFGVSGSIGEEVVRLQERGVHFDGPVIEDRHVKIANFSDPDGNRLHLTTSPPSPTSVPIDPSNYKPFFEYLGLRWNTIDGERVSVEMDVRDDLCGPARILQGGITATLVDVAAASTAALSGTSLVATTEMTVHYLAPGRVGPIRAVGELLRSGARSFAVEVRVFDTGVDDRLMAVALAAFVQIDKNRSGSRTEAATP
jgi:uncharacterized protein (TIGR00369 family)